MEKAENTVQNNIRTKIGGWIKNYNEKAPHSSLKMKSPAEFYREWLLKHG